MSSLAVHVRRVAGLTALIAGAAFALTARATLSVFAGVAAIVLLSTDLRRRSRGPESRRVTPEFTQRKLGWWAVARQRVFSLDEAAGWLLYVLGLVDLVWGWPASRFAGAITVGLGIATHARGVYIAWRENDI